MGKNNLDILRLFFTRFYLRPDGARMRDYVAILGLELLLDEADTKYGEPKCEQWEVVVPELVFSPHN